MSGISTFTRTPSAPVFGPTKRTRLDLMGIRFADAGGDGAGAGGDGDAGNNNTGGDSYTAPATQADLDRLISGRVAREQAKYSDYDALKASKVDYDALLASKLTADEKAVNDAREEGRTEVRQVLASERVKSALEKALAGRVPDAIALLDLDRATFVKGEGADTDAIKTWVEAHSTEAQAPASNKDRGQGNRSNDVGTTDAGRSAYQERHKK